MLVRNGIYVLFAAFLWSSCSSSPGTPTPRMRTVLIKGMQFQPAELTVNVGDTVQWINRDFVDHDVTEESSKAWSSSLMPAGKSWSMVVTGNSNYYCGIHQVMKGRILISKLAN